MKQALRNTTIADRLLVVIMLAVSGLGVFVAREALPRGADVIIEVDGRVAYTLPLHEDRTLTVRGSGGDAVVEISGGRVRVADATCNNRLCVREGWISGGVIVCLPAKIVVLVGTRGGDLPDGVDAKTG